MFHQSVSARDRILRQVVSNILAHRDYSSGFPAKIIIEKIKFIQKIVIWHMEWEN